MLALYQRKENINGVNVKIKILYKDEHFLLCEKPQGVPSQPDLTGYESVFESLKKVYPNVKLIHRLDVPTGGIMVFGLTQKATAKLCETVQDHNVFAKEYLAVLSSAPTFPEGQLKDELFHDKQKNKSFVVESKRKGSKEAVLEFKILKTLEDGKTLVLVRLYTGRTHQIRVQFASRGCAIMGDGKYGSREKCPNIALWSYSVSFPHPITSECINAVCEPPKDVYPWNMFDFS